MVRSTPARPGLAILAALATVAALAGAASAALVPAGDPVTLRLAETGREFVRQKLVDDETGAFVRQSVERLPDGTSVPIAERLVDEAIRENARLYRERKGAIARPFHARLTAALGSEPERLFGVAVIAPFDPTALPLGPSVEEVEGLPKAEDDRVSQAHRERLRTAIAALTGRLAPVVRAAGGQDVVASSDSPVVYAFLRPADALALARQTGAVGFLYDSEGAAVDELDTSVCSMGGDPLNDSLDAGDVEVAVIEGGRISTGSCLDVIAFYGEGSVSAPPSHATSVAGIIGSQLAGLPGVAPGANLLNGDIGTYLWAAGSIADALAFALDGGVDVANMSFGTDESGQIEAADWEVDFFVRHHRRLVVKSAGNTNTCPNTNNVTSPGLGFNVFTIGNLGDSGTCGIEDDFMNSGSCFGDPASPHGDREKPDASAPGTNITTTDVSCTTRIGSGTSFSAPHVAGAVALLMKRNNAVKHWPELSRALLMATAFNNVEGAARLSDRDGVGGIDVTRADRALQTGDWAARVVTSDDLDAGDVLELATVTIEPTTERFKAVIAWDSLTGADADYEALMIATDFDLDLVQLGTGEVVASSGSWDNSYEVIDVADPEPGFYRLRVRAAGGIATLPLLSEYLGAAWYGLRDCEGDAPDLDADGVCPALDNCDGTANAGQEDADGDGVGNACDNCPSVANPGQENLDDDASGDVCDPDDDNDGCEDDVDQDPDSSVEVAGQSIGLNCSEESGPRYAQADQDTDGDGTLDCADLDNDGDGLLDDRDPCPFDANPGPLGCNEFFSCPETVWWNVCLLGGCNEIFGLLLQVSNPDPTQPVARFDAISIVNRSLFVQPVAGQSLDDLAATFAAGAVSGLAPRGPNDLLLELWTRGRDGSERRLVEVARWDPASIVPGDLRSGAWLEVLGVPAGEEPGAPVFALDGVWTPGAAPGTSPVDGDADGIPTPFDGCSGLASSDATDADGDGIGNRCDADFDGNGVVGLSDFNQLRRAFGRRCGDPGYAAPLDLDSNCAIGLTDFNAVRAGFGRPPGPSGVRCGVDRRCPVP